MEDGCPRNLGRIAALAALRKPDDVALVGIEKGIVKTRTYQQLEERAEALAAYLYERGIRASDRVALIVRNQIEYVEALMGVLRIGAIAVPINALTGSHRIISILSDSGPVGVIADFCLGSEAVSHLNQADLLVRVGLNGGPDRWQKMEEIFERGDRVKSYETADCRTAMYVYTSGSTGTPKGVMVSHEAALYPIRHSPLYKGAKVWVQQRSLIAMPITHEAAFASLKEMLSVGGSAVIMEEFRSAYFLKSLAALKCTTMRIVPSMALAILAEEVLLESLDFSHLKLISIGGAPCEKFLLVGLQSRFPRATIFQFYGMTECGNIFTRKAVNGERPPIDSLGFPAIGVSVKLGEDDLQDVGELYVQTPMMMDGYNKGADVSRLNSGWLRTGDVFVRDGKGFFYFQGRADDMFVSGGENIFPIEIERIFLAHPGVTAACICAIPSLARGQAPILFVVSRDSSSLTEENLLTFYDGVGPTFGRPEKIFFLNALPLNQTGKIDRLALSIEAQRRTQSG